MSVVSDRLLRAMTAYKQRWLEFNAGSVRIHPRARRFLQTADELAENPYIDETDMQQLYREAMFNGRGRGRGRARAGRRHHPGRRRHHRRGRGMRRRFWRPMMAYPSFANSQAVVLRRLSARIYRLWDMLPNKKKWAKTSPAEMKSPSALFSRYPVPRR